tara:strand:+ start:3845 stop:4462 length:618 start_codon:yes stop_codon:yes gene_type:complete
MTTEEKKINMQKALNDIFINIIEKQGDITFNDEMFGFKNCLLSAIREGVGSETFEDWVFPYREDLAKANSPITDISLYIQQEVLTTEQIKELRKNNAGNNVKQQIEFMLKYDREGFTYDKDLPDEGVDFYKFLMIEDTLYRVRATCEVEWCGDWSMRCNEPSNIILDEFIEIPYQKDETKELSESFLYLLIDKEYMLPNVRLVMG